MRILFDEGVSPDLRRVLTGHECNSVRRLGWAGTLNGTLLMRAEKAGFEVLLTLDGHMRSEQNMDGRTIAVLVLRPRKQGDVPLRELAGKVLIALGEVKPGEIRVVRYDDPL